MVLRLPCTLVTSPSRAAVACEDLRPVCIIAVEAAASGAYQASPAISLDADDTALDRNRDGLGALRDAELLEDA
jgi:hypothetical protein